MAIKINARDLERNIKSGKVKDVEILKHEEVISQLEKKWVDAQECYDKNLTAKNKESIDRAEGD